MSPFMTSYSTAPMDWPTRGKQM